MEKKFTQSVTRVPFGSFVSSSARETVAIGEQLGESLDRADVVILNGDIGAGKTTFIRGVCRALKIADWTRFRSPTFTLLNEYETLGDGPSIRHADLYRIESPGAYETIGLFDMALTAEAVTLIEWGGRLEEFDRSPPGAIKVELTILDESARGLKITRSRRAA